MRRDEPVHLNILERICMVLDCNFGDIVDYFKEESDDEKLFRNICFILKREIITDYKRFIFPMEVYGDK